MRIYFIYSLWMSSLGVLFSDELAPTFLVLNQFNQGVPIADSTLMENFSGLSFEFEMPMEQLVIDLDQMENPAASQMDFVKELGEKYGVNYILFNQFNKVEGRFYLEGQLYKTRSGGLIHRRKLDLNHYEDSPTNELKMWIGEIIGNVRLDWQKMRESILYLDSEDIAYDKNPLGAMLRSLTVPGWGQVYSGNKLSGAIWAGAESFLALATLSSFLSYREASQSYLSNSNLYDTSVDEKEIAEYKALAESDWDDHVKYNNLIVIFAGMTGAGWIANSIHARFLGPRPYKNIYKKWDPSSKNSG